MRVLVGELEGGGELDLLECGYDPRFSLGTLGRSMDGQRLLHQLTHAHVGAEAGERILEDGLCALAEGEQVPAGELRDVGTLEQDAPRGDGDQRQGGAAQGRLAAARFAHHGHGLTPAQLEADSGDGIDGPGGEEGLAYEEGDAEFLDSQQRAIGFGPLSHRLPPLRSPRVAVHAASSGPSARV